MYRESLQKVVPSVTFEGVKEDQFRPLRLNKQPDQERDTLFELYQLSRQLHQSLDLGDVLRTLLEQTRALTSAEFASIILLNDRGIPVQWMMSDSNVAVTNLEIVESVYRGMEGQAIQRQKPLYIANTLQWGNNYAPLLPGHSFLVLPLYAHGKAQGVLTLAHQTPYAFTTQHTSLLEEASEMMGLALHHASAHTELQATATVNDEGKYKLVHDIRSPLMSVSASLEIIRRVLRMDLTDTEVQTMVHESLEAAQRSLKVVLDLATDLLDIKKLQIGQDTIEYQPVVVELLFDEVTGIVGSLALQRHIMFSYQVTPRTLSMEGDSSLLRRMLVNLSVNALRFTPEGGSVTLKASEVASSGHVLLVVEDTGPGVALEDREYIFRPFYQGKGESKRGTGLGLTVCREVALAHSGNIWVEDRPGGGSRFCVILPTNAHRAQFILTQSSS